MFDKPVPKISSPLVHAIEDAVLLGNIKEIDGVLELIKEEEDFPEDLRYALESLRYFRLYYGKGGELAPTGSIEKNKMLRMEAIWGREVLENLTPYHDLSESKYA
jgi:hypothetical protein